jgi:hypothetical protein
LREDGKVMKGPNYFRPNIGGILEAHARGTALRETAVEMGIPHVDRMAWTPQSSGGANADAALEGAVAEGARNPEVAL